MNIRPEYKNKSIRSYVVRAGRMTEGQKAAFDKYWSVYGLSLHNGKVDAESIFGRRAPQVMEIGFGMGGSLLQMVQAEQEKDFIGIEVHPPGAGRLINDAGKLELSNLRVYLADAIDVMDDCIEDASIDRLQVYFPDPWHKKKHNKRRLIQPAFVQRIHAKLKSGGVFHLATDWEPYAEYMLEVMKAAEGYENIAGADQYSPRPDYRPATKFEQRGQQLGHGVWDLLYRKMG
ncbi:MAG: tRNA (guanine-N7-)-methyltransferase [Porticoccus sp.]|jgi:tRNA (guanine-N7-)-methyltransferase